MEPSKPVAGSSASLEARHTAEAAVLPDRAAHAAPSGGADRAVVAIERIAGISLLVVGVLTFLTVILRKFFDTTIPDWYDLSRLLQGIAILWGIASACWRNGHIMVDLVWEQSTPRGRLRIDRIATAAVLVFVTAVAAIALMSAWEMRTMNLLTSDLRLPQWPFYAMGALGLVAAAWMTVLRLRRLRAGTAQEAR